MEVLTSNHRLHSFRSEQSRMSQVGGLAGEARQSVFRLADTWRGSGHCLHSPGHEATGIPPSLLQSQFGLAVKLFICLITWRRQRMSQTVLKVENPTVFKKKNVISSFLSCILMVSLFVCQWCL